MADASEATNGLITREQKRRALEQQVARLDRYLKRYQQQSDQFVRWRSAVFFVGLALTFVGFQVSDLAAAVVALFWFGVWMGFSRQHGRLKAMMARFEGWKAIKRAHLARMQLDWERIPARTAFDAPVDHPFARDLDIVGERSLHHLLDTAISRGGSRRLLDWLLDLAPDLDVTHRRQTLVRELTTLQAFRDRLTLDARMAAADRPRQGRWDFERLRVWLQGQQQNAQIRRILLPLSGLAAVNIALFLLFVGGTLEAPLFAYSFALYAFGLTYGMRNLGNLFGDAMTMQDELRRLGAVVARLETFEYGNRHALAELCAPFRKAGHQPSRELRRVGWIAAGTSLRGNPIVWIMINFIVPWDLAFAYWLERARVDLADEVPRWLDAFYELEALNALAGFANRNPAATMPLLNAGTGAHFSGEALGHPLIDAETRVTNDFTLEGAGQVVILTGSNMSGKSSFLRTLGVNLCLAYAGGPVLATRFEAGMMRLFTSIRVSDSVQDGFSYFYAEVRRLKALLNALRDGNDAPLFFLIDEIFRGTNNRERLLGSRAYIRALSGGAGMGLIATHDLELVKLADDDASISNAHFREFIEGGQIVFDYKLREGPCPTTNALKIMALEGLPVEDEGVEMQS